jgi:hypothetical protein
MFATPTLSARRIDRGFRSHETCVSSAPAASSAATGGVNPASSAP